MKEPKTQSALPNISNHPICRIKQNKSGQTLITILVILVVALLILIIIKTMQTTRLSSSRQKDIEQKLSILDNYITSELKSALDEALIEAGKHGGMIVINSHSRLPAPILYPVRYSFDYISGEDLWTVLYIVQYDLFPEIWDRIREALSTYIATGPRSINGINTADLYSILQSSLSSLSSSLNDINLRLPKGYPCTDPYLSKFPASTYCLDAKEYITVSLDTKPLLHYTDSYTSDYYNMTRTIEWRLEEYIKAKLKQSLSFDAISNMGYNITKEDLASLGIDDMKVKVTIGKNEVVAKLYLPIKSRGLLNKIKMGRKKEYLAESKVRLGLIYELINKSFYEGELNDFDYDFIYEMRKLLADHGMTITKIAEFTDPDHKLQGFDGFVSGNDVFMIHDPNSIANNKAYDFIFARSNRIPAIKVIDAQTNQEVWYLNLRPDTTLILTSSSSHATPPMPRPNQKVLNIICKDLDEDNLAIQIYGMGEDRDDNCFLMPTGSESYSWSINECYYYPWISSCQDRCDHDLMLWTLDGVNSTQRRATGVWGRLFFNNAELDIGTMLSELESMGIGKNMFHLYVRCVELDDTGNIKSDGLSDYADIIVNVFGP